MSEPVMTFCGVVIAALLSALALVMVAKINTVGQKVDTTVKQTASTGNGYADETRESLRQLHRRLDAQNSHTARRDDHLDRVLTRLDDRLTHIEETI